ncbi:MAG: hypothetical protein IPI32_01745 [Austwickia sp.]|nr:hypothetical protein [Austwickia sp.]MBK8437684.1 hypothetical protein [Austwickia sp.]MBK9099995.1 hypothetical protein [Austwickia sp.]
MPHTSSDTPPSALTPLARHPVIALGVLLAGALLGALLGLTAAPVYRAEARLSVGPASNSAYVISGYPLAVRDLAANYSRWVRNSSAVQPGWGVEGVSAVSASPIPDSGVIRIEAESRDPARAVAGAQAVATTLATLVGTEQDKNDPKLVYAEYEKLAPQVAAAQARVENAKTDAARRQARVQLAMVQLQRDAFGERYRRLFSDPQVVSRLQLIQPAVAVGDSRKAALARWLLVGVGAGAAAALVVTTLLDRRRRRRGAPDVPGAADVPCAADGPDGPDGPVADTTSRAPVPMRSDASASAGR